MFFFNASTNMKKIIEEIELKVCRSCDAPLPFKPKKHSYFKNNSHVCDDCLKIKEK